MEKIPLENKLLEWLKKTGYPLELYGESILSESEFKIINSYLYNDMDTNISRELDLLASLYLHKDDMDLEMTLLIECKKSDKPLILLGNKLNKSNKISLGEYLYISNPNSRIIWNLKTDIILPGKSAVGFKIIQGFTDGDEFIHKAANTLFKSFYDFTKNTVDNIEYDIQSNKHTIAIPILLIDAPLLQLSLNETNELELEHLDSCILEFRNPSDELEDVFSIPIITKKYFKEFILLYKDLSYAISDNLINNPLFQLKRFHTTKMHFTDYQSND